MLSRAEYKRKFADDIENAEQAFRDDLIAEEKVRPGISETVLRQAQVAVRKKVFNNYRPADPDAWYVIAHPVRVFSGEQFEYQRLHLLAILVQFLSDHLADEQVIETERHVAQMLA
jgi:hypothetical protein